MIEGVVSLVSSDFWRFDCGPEEDGRSGKDRVRIDGVVSELQCCQYLLVLWNAQIVD